ncbi:hypothetical protein NCC49_004687 [Naganishia albida]|nr:hypothetical protein NCC49_004687 [Naganishia albida]
MSSRYSDPYRHYTAVGDVLVYDPNNLIALQNTDRTIFELYGIPPPSSSPPGAIISRYSRAPPPPPTAGSYNVPFSGDYAGPNMILRHSDGWRSYSCYPTEAIHGQGNTAGNTPPPEEKEKEKEKKKGRFGAWICKHIVWNEKSK